MLIRKTLPQPAIRRVVFTNGGPLPLAQVWAPAFPVLRPPGILVQPECFAAGHGVLPFWLCTHNKKMPRAGFLRNSFSGNGFCSYLGVFRYAFHASYAGAMPTKGASA